MDSLRSATMTRMALSTLTGLNTRPEFSYSNYEQNYVLPDDVVKDQISAKVEDGILTITMPKTAPQQKVTKAIEVS